MSRVFYCLALTILGPSLARADGGLAEILRETRWISFAPTTYEPNRSPAVLPSDDSLRLDLATLRSAGFTGLITYGTDVQAVPRIAEALGFQHMVLGIWDPFNARELEAAVKAVRSHDRLITGVIVGNEGLLNGRYTVDEICAVMGRVRKMTGKPVSTTEPVDLILSEPKIAQCSTFVTVNAHPFFSNQKRPPEAVQWTLEAWAAVRGQYPERPILFKEVGLPTSGDVGMSETAQNDYYVRLARTAVLFSYFEAFDARFKDGPIEQSWGLWHSDRTPKLIVRFLPWRKEDRQ